MYENGSPKYTVDLLTGTKYPFGTSMGQMASYGGGGSSGSSIPDGIYKFSSANGGGATWTAATGWVASNGAQTFGATGSGGYNASMSYWSSDEVRSNFRYYGYIDNTEYIPLDEEEMKFVAMIVAEAGGESELYWEIVAHVIMNRKNNPQDVFSPGHLGKKKEDITVTDIITQVNRGRLQFNGLDDKLFADTMRYLENRDGSDSHVEEIIGVVMPIYYGDAEDFTGGAQWYYSPKRQQGTPSFARSEDYKEIILPNTNHDYEIMRLYKR